MISLFSDIGINLILLYPTYMSDLSPEQVKKEEFRMYLSIQKYSDIQVCMYNSIKSYFILKKQILHKIFIAIIASVLQYLFCSIIAFNYYYTCVASLSTEQVKVLPRSYLLNTTRISLYTIHYLTFQLDFLRLYQIHQCFLSKVMKFCSVTQPNKKTYKCSFEAIYMLKTSKTVFE